MAWQTPKTDWDINPKAPAAADFNRIEGNILEIYNDVVTGKQNLYNAILAKGVTPGSQAFADLVAAIGNIIKATGTAQPAQVLEGVPFSNQYGAQIGTMPNNGGQTATLQISGASKPTKVVPTGYTSGGTIIAELDPSLAQYIMQGITIGGVTGTFNGKKWTSNTTMSTVEGSFEKLVVSGLGFTPSIVICLVRVNGLHAYIACGLNYYAYVSSVMINVLSQPATIRSGRFTLFIQENKTQELTPTNRSWIAIE